MFLIDTNILSEFMRREPSPGVLAWAEGQPGFKVSVITLEELVFGLTRKSLYVKRLWLDEFLAGHCEVIGITPAIAMAAGTMRGNFSVRGIVRDPADMLIAATALLHHLPLATRNTSDFEGCGITVFNPFQP